MKHDTNEQSDDVMRLLRLRYDFDTTAVELLLRVTNVTET